MKNDNEIENLLHNILVLQKIFGYNRKEMAEILNIGIEGMKKLENGELPKRLGIIGLFNIQEKFKIDVSELFKRKF